MKQTAESTGSTAPFDPTDLPGCNARAQKYDTTDINIAATLECQGWKLDSIELVRNPYTNRSFGRFHYTVPAGVDKSAYLFDLQQGRTIVEPMSLCRKRNVLKQMVDDLRVA